MMLVSPMPSAAHRKMRLTTPNVSYRLYTEIHASGGEPGSVDRLVSTLPIKRGGHAFEVARAILWLISDDASYTTGSFVDVTGGR
jgi:NAD(P)-dependent dehydrogenase (short-subunit alcohol dehydrogenase family)